MTYFIGGNSSGQLVERKHLDCKDQSISMPFGPLSGMKRPEDRYLRRSVSFHGTIKTFYLIEGSKPIDHRDQIIDLWDKVETDVYAI